MKKRKRRIVRRIGRQLSAEMGEFTVEDMFEKYEQSYKNVSMRGLAGIVATSKYFKKTGMSDFYRKGYGTARKTVYKYVGDTDKKTDP